MHDRLRYWGNALVALSAVGMVACSSKEPTYELSLVCSGATGTTSACPAGQTCPILPAFSYGCGDPPADPDHRVTLDGSVPSGCIANLPYGDPQWGNAQASCTCTTSRTPDNAAPMPKWYCPR